jgi:hypothetical protein
MSISQLDQRCVTRLAIDIVFRPTHSDHPLLQMIDMEFIELNLRHIAERSSPHCYCRSYRSEATRTGELTSSNRTIAELCCCLRESFVSRRERKHLLLKHAHSLKPRNHSVSPNKLRGELLFQRDIRWNEVTTTRDETIVSLIPTQLLMRV